MLTYNKLIKTSFYLEKFAFKNSEIYVYVFQMSWTKNANERVWNVGRIKQEFDYTAVTNVNEMIQDY